MYSFSDSTPDYDPANYSDDALIAGIDKAVEAGTMVSLSSYFLSLSPAASQALIDEVIDEAFEDEPDYVDYQWEDYYHAHSSSITGVYEMS